jgi:hypothetical protein
MSRLNLGSGHRRLDGWVNVDHQPMTHCDMLLDIEAEPWPFDDGSVTEIEASHVLEHITDLTWVMREAYRVMEPGAIMRIAVPHHHSEGFYGDPTHKTPITIAVLELFSKKKCAEARAKGWPNTPLADYHDIDFDVVSYEFDLTPRWQNKGLDQSNLAFVIESYNNVVDQVRFVLRRV